MAASATEHDPVLQARAFPASVACGCRAPQRDGAATRVGAATCRVTRVAFLRACTAVSSDGSIGCEAVYEGAPEENVLTALAQTREVDDDRALAEALSMTHHVFPGPRARDVPPVDAEEQIRRASAAGTDPRVVRPAVAHRGPLPRRRPARRGRVDRATPVPPRWASPRTGFIVACMDVMRLIRAGRLVRRRSAIALPAARSPSVMRTRPATTPPSCSWSAGCRGVTPNSRTWCRNHGVREPRGPRIRVQGLYGHGAAAAAGSRKPERALKPLLDIGISDCSGPAAG